MAGLETKTLYKEECPHCYELSLREFIKSEYLSQLSVLNDVIADFKSGNKDVVHDKLFNLYNDNLQKGVRSVFKPGSGIKKQEDYLYKFDANTSKFAAYKANYVGNKLRELDPKDFEKNAKQLLKTYNRYQVTEYNTTVSRCRTAKQFGNFQATARLYPNLEWLRSRSANPRELHLSFVGIVLPINDPFWQANQPGNLYGCKCDWRVSDKPVSSDIPESITPSVGLEGNPYQNREIFTEKHKYFTDVTKPDAKEIDSFLSENILKQFKKEDDIWVHPLLQFDKNENIPQLKKIAGIVAKTGNQVYIMPPFDKKSILYKYVYQTRGAIENKCPDMIINNLLFDFKSYDEHFDSGKIGSMLTSGRKQNDRFIIDLRELTTPVRDVIDNIQSRVADGQNIKEVWGLMKDNSIEILYP